MDHRISNRDFHVISSPRMQGEKAEIKNDKRVSEWRIGNKEPVYGWGCSRRRPKKRKRKQSHK